MEPPSEAREPKSPEKPSTEKLESSVDEISSPLEEPQVPLDEAEDRLAEPPLEVPQGNEEPEEPEEMKRELKINAGIENNSENSRGPNVEIDSSSNIKEEISQRPPEELVTASVTEATEQQNIQRPPDVIDVTLTTGNHSSDIDNSTGPPKEIIRQKIEENETSRAPDVVLTNNTEQLKQQETAGCSKWISNECPETTATDDSQVPSTSREDSQVPSTSRDDSQVASTSTAPEVCAVTASTASASAPRTPKRKNLRPASSRKKVPSTRAKIASIVRAWKKGQRRRRNRERLTKNLFTRMLGPGFWRDILVPDQTEAATRGIRYLPPTSTITRPEPSPPEAHRGIFTRTPDLYPPIDYSQPQPHCSSSMYVPSTSAQPLNLRPRRDNVYSSSTTTTRTTAPVTVSEVIVLDDSDDEATEENQKYSPLDKAEDKTDEYNAGAKRKARDQENVQRQIDDKKIKREDIVNQQPFLQTPVQTLGAAGICGILTTPLPSLMEEDG